MGLKQNGVLIAQMPLRFRGGAFCDNRTVFGRSDLRNSNTGLSSYLAGIPSGYRHPVSWLLPLKPGALSSRNAIDGAGAMDGAGALGKNGDASLAGTSDLTGIGDLIVSTAATLAGLGSVEGEVLAVLQMAGELAGSGDAAGALDALGFAIASLEGSGAFSPVASASGELEALIEVSGSGDVLTAGQISSEILDSQLVETGLSVREALRLCLAALAGKVSGAGGSTITIRSADDTKDRIVATVDGNGNRSSITLDAS